MPILNERFVVGLLVYIDRLKMFECLMWNVRQDWLPYIAIAYWVNLASLNFLWTLFTW